MTQKEAELFIDQRKAEVDKWERKPKSTDRPDADPDPSGDWLAVSYWYGPKMQGRIHKVARTLVEAVEACKQAEAG